MLCPLTRQPFTLGAMPILDSLLGWLGERSLRLKARRTAKASTPDASTALEILSFFHRYPEKQEFLHEGSAGVALWRRSDVTRVREHAPGVGERVMAAMVGPGINYGMPSGWAQWRGEMVQHYRHFVYEAIDAICCNVACLSPNVAFVRHRAEPMPAHRALWGRKRLLKTLHTIKPHEEIDPVEPDHPLMKRFRNPNGPDTAYDLWYELVMFLKLTGNSYLWMVPNRIGMPVELWVLPSHWVWPVSDGSGRLVDRYKIVPWPGRMTMEIPAEEVIHFRFKNPMHKVDGYSPLMAGSETIDTYESVQRSRFWSFKNGCFVTGALELGENYNDPSDASLERIYAKFFARFQGEWNYGKPIITPPGAKYTALKIAPDEMDYVESAEQLQNWVLSLFRVPKEIVGLQPSGSDLSWYAPMHQFCAQVMKPLLLYMGQVLTEKLASRWDRELRVWWDDPTPDNPQQVNADLSLDAQYGTITDNEWRAIRGREAWPNEAADMPWKDQTRSPVALNKPGGVQDLEGDLIDWTKEEDEAPSLPGATEDPGPNGKPEAGDTLAGLLNGKTGKRSRNGRGLLKIVESRTTHFAAAQEKNAGPHKFASTQFDLADAGYSRSQGSPVPILQDMARSIADEHLASDGREQEPHVTVKYGLHTSDPDDVREVVEKFGPVALTLGKSSIFPAKESDSQRGGDEYDVVKVDVDSPDLVRLNRLLAGALDHTDTHPKYQPHVTLAYVKPGYGARYAGRGDVDGMKLSLTRLVFSDADGLRTVIELAGMRKRSLVKVGGNGTCEQGQRADLTGCTPASGQSNGHAETDTPKSAGKVRVAKKPQPAPAEAKPNAKAERAKLAHVMVDKTIQRYAEEKNEPRFAKMIGGISLPDSEPVDVVVERGGKRKVGVELKTLVKNTNAKITMDSYSQVRKILWEQEHGAVFHTVVSDDSAVFPTCKDSDCDDSKRVYYYRRGVAGSARIGSLHRCQDETELKKLMAAPEGKLPEGAQRTDGKLRVGTWEFFTDAQGKGYRNSETGKVARAKK